MVERKPLTHIQDRVIIFKDNSEREIEKFAGIEALPL
jgi:hypothetical protein